MPLLHSTAAAESIARGTGSWATSCSRLHSQDCYVCKLTHAYISSQEGLWLVGDKAKAEGRQEGITAISEPNLRGAAHGNIKHCPSRPFRRKVGGRGRQASHLRHRTGSRAWVRLGLRWPEVGSARPPPTLLRRGAGLARRASYSRLTNARLKVRGAGTSLLSTKCPTGLLVDRRKMLKTPSCAVLIRGVG